MKAAILKAWGTPLVVEQMPDPSLASSGEVLVDVAATPVITYTHEVLSGKRKYLLELPAVPGPGGIGRVRKTGADATHLKVGDWVWVDSTIRSRDDSPSPDIYLLGVTAGTERGLPLHRYFHEGTYAEQVRVPTENVTRIGDISPEDAPRWCALGALLVPLGGFLAVNVTPGETVLVNGATGSFGRAAVMVALGLGAEKVLATGRNQKVLGELAKRHGKRVVPVPMSGDEQADTKKMQGAAGGPIDVVLDMLPPAASPQQARAAVMAVRPRGRVVLMGGVGMLGNAGLELPYPWLMRNCISLRGQWMYDADAPAKLVRLIRGGLIDLANYSTELFPLEKINEAVEYAAKDTGRMTIIQP